ncbi:hypothetical protein CHS0354_012383, partial [Potamilus streckersoni]
DEYKLLKRKDVLLLAPGRKKGKQRGGGKTEWSLGALLNYWEKQRWTEEMMAIRNWIWIILVILFRRTNNIKG